MRETKFRGLNRNSNKWYYGSLLVTRQLGIYHAQIWLLNEDSPVPVDIETTGEWVGFTDKKGKEIYEGDIVGYPDDEVLPEYLLHYRGIVRFGKVDIGCNRHEYSYIINGFYVESEGSASERLTDDMNRGEIELLGNIYEHPELLSAKP